MCPDFTKECTNGYVAYIGNSCTCRCPKGLDPETGCKTVYRGDKNLKSINWPSTEFSMLKPRDGCPRGFKEGNMIQYVKGTRVSPQFNFDAINGDDYFDIKFCTNDKKSPGSNNAEWESGQYCILSYDGFCPEGFFDGFIKYGKDKVKVVAWPLPDGKFNDEIVWHFCCREDGSLKDPLYLPTKEPFSLFPRDSECQQVKDMKAEKQWFMIQSSGDIFVTGSSPNVRIAKKTSVFVDICYYWPIDYNCGGIINISNDNPVVEIKSPNYPDVYNLKQECSWTIMGPENTHIKLDFEGFDVESTIQEDGFPTCGDSLEVRSMLPGHPGVNYCGPSFKPTISSEVNYIGLTLSSGLTEVRKGFKAVATLITDADMCYTDKGEDYRGTANVTTLFEPCLPWTQVQHCPHHAFNAGDLDDDLVDNYCRNPGSGTKPWCYTHYEDCSRNYCDPCRLENCYDLLVDCNMLLFKDASFCQSNVEAQRICRKSCGFCMKTKITPVSRVSCAPPSPLDDAVSNEKLRKQYKVGDQVTFRCKNGKELEKRVCLSDGSWSGSNFVCGRCPNGWIPFKEKCYRWFDSYENWTASVNICNGYSSIIASAKDSDEFNFLLKLRQDVRSFWIGIQYDQNVRDNIWLEDGTPVSFNNFKSGSRMGCAYVDKNGDWRGTPCDSVEFFGFICKLSPSARTVCSDARDDCEEFLREEPGACEGYPDFAWHICPKSCYRCKSEIDVKCPMPVLAANSEMVKTKSVLYPGTMIEYRCKKGFILQGGDLRRTCLLSGKLTGDNPVCLGEKFVSTPNNRVELRQRTQDGSDGVAYTADNEAMRIHKTGKLVRWQFYGVYDGEVAFQVWRKTGKADRYKLVGQNIIEHTGNHRTRTIEVIPSGQIDVVAGDMIGVYLPKENKGGITFDKCVAENTFGDFGNQKVFVDKIKTSLDWIVGNSYDVENDKSKCKIFSLRGYVL